MSVTFSIRGLRQTTEDPFEGVVNMASVNAREVLTRLGLADEFLHGSSRARLVASACRRALQLEDEGEQPSFPFSFGRPAGRINYHIQKILDLCHQAGDLGVIQWG
jgi:hypothetical protein